VNTTDDGGKWDKLLEGWAFRVDSWNVDSLTGRVDELLQVLADRWIGVASVQ